MIKTGEPWEPHQHEITRPKINHPLLFRYSRLGRPMVMGCKQIKGSPEDHNCFFLSTLQHG